MKKTLAVLLSLILVMVALAGCGGGGTPDPAPAPPPDAPADTGGTPDEGGDVTLTMSRWAGPHADDQKKVVAGYPNATIKMDDIDYGNLKAKQIQSLSQTGELDLVWASEIWLPEYVSNGWVLPLDDYIASSGLDMGIYAAGMVNANTYNGKIYAFPTFAQTLIITYNKEWFERENQSVPTTIDELVAVAKYFKEQGTGIALPIAQGQASVDMFASFLYSAGGDYFDANGNFDITTDAAMTAAKLFKDLCTYAIDGSLTWHHDQVSEAIRTEKAPFGITVTGLSFLDADPEQSAIVDKVGYVAIPGAKTISGCVSYWSWTIAANSPNPQAAFDFVTWLCSPEIEKEQALMNSQITAVSALAADPEVVASIPFLPATNETLANAKTQPTSESASVIFDPISAALSEMASSNKPFADILAELQDTLKDVKI